MKTESLKNNIKFHAKKFLNFPAKQTQVFYRIPFLFLQRAEERIQDALNCVVGLKESLKDNNFEIKEDSQENTLFVKEDTAIVEFQTTDSDLWVKTDHFLEKTPKELNSIEQFFLNLERQIYKYVHKNDTIYAYPSEKNLWKNEVKGYIGLDAGSISINIAFLDQSGIIFDTEYTLTEGDVINNIKKAFTALKKRLPANTQILGSGVTGSGHEISSALLNADVYETELDAHAEATLHMLPDTQVIFDIGGQDSKVMYIEDGELDEAGMNKKCGAGTGAFLDAQADRLGIPIEKFGETGLKAKKPYSFSSMCTVFVGRDLIAEQAKGNTKENIIAGLHRSLAMNFYSTLGINKKHLKTPIAFQGGVASNTGVKKALEDLLFESRGEEVELFIPMHHKVMGAIGMALFARDEVENQGKFRGIDTICRINSDFTECTKAKEIGCNKETICDLVHLHDGDNIVKTLYACEQYYAAKNESETQNLKVTIGG